MFIGAIQSISPDIYEAADLDGANAWQKFWHIIFPGIRTIIALQLILAIKGAASVFEIPYIITGGKMGTSTFVIKTIETGFQVPEDRTCIRNGYRSAVYNNSDYDDPEDIL